VHSARVRHRLAAKLIADHGAQDERREPRPRCPDAVVAAGLHPGQARSGHKLPDGRDVGRDHPAGRTATEGRARGNAAVEPAGAVPVAGPPEDVADRGRPYPRPGITLSDT